MLKITTSTKCHSRKLEWMKEIKLKWRDLTWASFLSLQKLSNSLLACLYVGGRIELSWIQLMKNMPNSRFMETAIIDHLKDYRAISISTSGRSTFSKMDQPLSLLSQHKSRLHSAFAVRQINSQIYFLRVIRWPYKRRVNELKRHLVKNLKPSLQTIRIRQFAKKSRVHLRKCRNFSTNCRKQARKLAKARTKT